MKEKNKKIKFDVDSACKKKRERKKIEPPPPQNSLFLLHLPISQEFILKFPPRNQIYKI